jgi:hypothetical protein
MEIHDDVRRYSLIWIDFVMTKWLTSSLGAGFPIRACFVSLKVYFEGHI